MAGRYYKVQTLNVVVEVKLSAAEEQEKWLADALNVVKQQAFYMRRALPPPLPAFADSQDSGNLREALKYSAQMLSELRTSKLAPQKYYELCTRLKVHRIRTVPQPCVHGMADIVVCGELQNLEAFFWDEHKMRGRSCVDLYELVQHAGNIVPRLYLLCTVGAVYIRSKEGPAKEVLSDLSEVCKGVQHPIRGLFLRAHLTQCSRDKLPDTGSEYEGEGGTVVDAVEFLLQNFTEMNKLWVRMQHQGPATEREKREQERRELRDLVGKNLHLLSQLEGVNLDMYKTVVLPRILEQQGRDSQQYLMDCLIQVFPDDFHLNTLETLLGACPECVHCIHPPSPPLSFPSSLVPFLIGPPFQIVNCRDEIAQQYLMDCLIQVFPDDFHLNTLETLLGACPELQPSVDVRTIMSQLMDRLSTFMDKNPDALPHFLEVDAFAKFNSAVSKVMEAQAEMPLKSVVSLHLALLQFVLRVHPDRLDYIDQVLAACVGILDARRQTKDSPTTKQLVALLSAALDKFGPGGVLTVLQLPHYARVMGHLDHETNKAMAVVIIQNMVKHETTIGDPEKVECLLSLVRHLTQDMDGVPPVDELDMDDFSEEQNLVARLVHLLVNPDPRIQFQILAIIRTHLFKGGQSRLRFTIPSLVFCSLQLVHQLLSQGITGADQALATAGAAASQAAMAAAAAGEGPVTPLTLFLFLHKVVETLSEFVPPLALKLALECAQVASACGLEPIAYDLFTLAFVIYEEEISDSKAQVTALHLIIGTLQRCHVFAEENRDTLTHKATGYSAKLLKKADQCRAVCTCAHLFWSDEENGPRDGERVVLCLKRALKIANAAAQQLSSAARVLSRFTAFTPIYHSHPRIPILLISYPLLPMHQGGAVSQESAQDCQRSSSAALSRCQSARFARGAAGGDSQQGNPHVTPVVLQGLIELITSELAVDGATVDATVHSFYRATLAHIKDQKHKAGAIGEKYAEIQI
ncbi:unnamed protein product [Closterium sp. NIES-65]|nr:unnamed protein product [Closterium sp. NIES-65]